MAVSTETGRLQSPEFGNRPLVTGEKKESQARCRRRLEGDLHSYSGGAGELSSCGETGGEGVGCWSTGAKV